MQFLWGMVNALQLIVYIPLFSINMPSNAKYFYNLIVGFVEFDIFPADWVGEDLFKFEEGEAFNANFETMDIFLKANTITIFHIIILDSLTVRFTQYS